MAADVKRMLTDLVVFTFEVSDLVGEVDEVGD